MESISREAGGNALMEKEKQLDLIVSQIVKLSLEESSNDPVRNIYSISIDIANKIENIMRDIREQERKEKT